MSRHIFRPGDMAIIINCIAAPIVIGLHCIVESEEHTLKLIFRNITAVDITVAHPFIKKANITCLQFVPPEEWPESVFKVRELVLVEKDNGIKRERPTKQRELETTE